MRKWIAAGVVAGLTLAGCRQNDVPVGPNLAVESAQGSQRYIVVYNSSVTDTRAEIARNVSTTAARVDLVYQHALRGWAGTIAPTELQRLRNDPRVAFIEPDAIVTINTSQNPTPSWGLDRIDQRNLPLNSTYTYNTTGSGVHFYGIDTGILYSHNDFGGRASAGFDAVSPPNGALDCNGHGTHTASNAAGTTYGVAKAMTIVGVRVLDCGGSGFNSWVIAGIDWVTLNAIKPAVANMSLGGGASAALDASLNNSIASGVVYSVASGNSNADACNYSPARVANAITVNASTITDVRASFSNYGTCTDIFAPGSGITAAWIGSNIATATISGTSMAAPHVAGVVGLYLQGNPAATPAQVATVLLSNATPGIIGNPGTGSPNLLLYMGFIIGTPNLPPVANFTFDCTAPGLQPHQCNLDATSSSDDVGIVPPYSWDFGNGKTANTTNPQITYRWATGGSYNVMLTVRDAGGLSNSITKVVNTDGGPPPNQAPSATITAPAAGATFLQGASVSFAGSGSDPEDGALTGGSLVWTSSRDGQIGTGTSFSKSNLTVGTHTITLTATDSQGATGSTSRSITINQTPTASISSPAANSSFTQGVSVSFAGTGSDLENGALTGGSLVWTSSRDGQIGTGTSFSKSNLTVGTHTITLTATDSQGATGTATRTITIASANQPPVANFTFDCEAPGLQPHQCTLNASSSTDDVGVVPPYGWDFGNGRTANTTNPQVTFRWAAAGSYNVSLTVRDVAGLTNTIVKVMQVP